MEDIELWQGDCLKLMQEILDKSVDFIICDLPYGTTACKWDSVLDLSELWKEYKRMLKENGVVILFGQEPFSSIVRTSNLSWYKYDWVWKKNKPSNFQLMNYQPGRIHENIMIFSEGKACYTKKNNNMPYNPQLEKRDKVRKANAKIYTKVGKEEAPLLHSYVGNRDNFKEYEYKQPTTILDFSNEVNKVHPTQKPVGLLEYLIKTYSKEGDLILDNCMGSGSTGVACINTGRNFIGIEKDNTYFEIAKERITQRENELNSYSDEKEQI